MIMGPLSGIVPVLPTPFRPDGSLDLDSLARALDFCAGKGLPAACIPAYASEFYKLTMDERYRLVEEAVKASAGRVRIIAQSNHFSGALAGQIARRNEDLGADFVSVAIPRMFDISESDVHGFLEGVLRSTSLPVLVQDFNPGGQTISASLARRVNEDYPHFRYLKLEQPLMAPRVVEILQQTAGKVQVLEGWGGLYLLEGIQAGICGAMPALGVADVLQETYDLAVGGNMNGASDRFERILPYLVFSLQNMELLVRMEKRLLVRRGVLASEHVREATLTPDPSTEAHVDFLIDRVLKVVESASGS
ncbi:MAG: dihydrodipicolinate synthase family protein [Bryobacterales bacterium]|nr:dihydrodipicolinate synthase family protein [Bryobacterales bacterium]